MTLISSYIIAFIVIFIIIIIVDATRKHELNLGQVPNKDSEHYGCETHGHGGDFAEP